MWVPVAKTRELAAGRQPRRSSHLQWGYGEAQETSATRSPRLAAGWRETRWIEERPTSDAAGSAPAPSAHSTLVAKVLGALAALLVLGFMGARALPAGALLGSDDATPMPYVARAALGVESWLRPDPSPAVSTASSAQQATTGVVDLTNLVSSESSASGSSLGGEFRGPVPGAPTRTALEPAVAPALVQYAQAATALRTAEPHAHAAAQLGVPAPHSERHLLLPARHSDAGAAGPGAASSDASVRAELAPLSPPPAPTPVGSAQPPPLLPEPASTAAAQPEGAQHEPANPAAPASALDPSAGVDGRVILNQATAQELTRLPGIGSKRAEDILALRTRLGGFRRPTDLLRVKGIGARTLKKMLPHLLVDAPAPAP